MKRKEYKNGDPIILSCGCDGCSPSMINGILCHETGCPDAWRDEKAECRECGCEFYKGSPWDEFCGPECGNIYYGWGRCPTER